MVQITEVNIIHIDKTEESWLIEGEILFEDLTTPFSVTYSPDYDELEDLELEIDPGRFDKTQLKEMIVDAAYEFDESF